MSNVADILNLIEETKKDSLYDVYIPSKGETYRLLPMTANDQKELVKALIDSPVYSNESNVKFGMILPSILPPELNINELTTFDKLFLAITIRKENIKDEYVAKFTDKDGKKFEKEISLTKHLDKVGKVKHPEATEVKVDDIRAVLSIPSISSDLEFENFLAYQATSLKTIDETQLKNIISQLYITNIMRYIEVLEIKGTEIPFRLLPIQDKLQIGSALLSKFTKEAVNAIDEKFGKPTMNVVQYSFKHEGEQYDGNIAIDNTFFMV